MPTKTNGRVLLGSLLALSVGSLLIAGCSGGSIASTNTNTSTPTGASFVMGTDAPMASVTSFTVQLTSVNAFTSSDCTGTSVSLISGTPSVDFARFNGLQTLLDMNDVPAGTYNCVSITLGTAMLGYLDTSAGGAPTIQTEPATLTTSNVTAPLTNPMVVARSGAPVGLHMDFDLHKSIQVDATDQITGAVTPTFHCQRRQQLRPGAYIDEFDAAVVNTDAGHADLSQFKVLMAASSPLTSTVKPSGTAATPLATSPEQHCAGLRLLDRADATIDADEIAILSDNGFYAAGQVTYVNPS